MEKMIVVLLMALYGVSCSTAQPADKVTGSHVQEAYREASFNMLKQLKGTWRNVEKSPDEFYIDFALASHDGVLVESWMRKGDVHSLTLYHRDDERLMSTHYCPQGNQPRMVLEKSSSPSTVSFIFHDATNLNPNEQSYQVALSFEFSEDANTVVRHETYQEPKGPVTSSMTLKRIE